MADDWFDEETYARAKYLLAYDMDTGITYIGMCTTGVDGSVLFDYAVATTTDLTNGSYGENAHDFWRRNHIPKTRMDVGRGNGKNTRGSHDLTEFLDEDGE